MTAEPPLHDFIDMEAYDVVSGDKHRKLVEALEQIDFLDRSGHDSQIASDMGYIARSALAGRSWKHE